MTVLDRVGLRAWGWIGPIAVALLAFVLRIWNVSSPKKLTFDETYYAKDAWGLLTWGYARDGLDDANERIIAGETDVFTTEPTWIVHPDGGKWLIALGEKIFGLTPLGWRFAAVVVGSLTVLVLARLVLRLTGSIALAGVRGPQTGTAEAATGNRRPCRGHYDHPLSSHHPPSSQTHQEEAGRNQRCLCRLGDHSRDPSHPQRRVWFVVWRLLGEWFGGWGIRGVSAVR